MGQKAEMDKTERAAGLQAEEQDKRGDIEKWDQTGSSEIPDRGETSEIPGLPSWVGTPKDKTENQPGCVLKGLLVTRTSL